MKTAIQVARFLIKLSSDEPEPEFMSQLRLQKLLYYVQGWSLALRKNPMFHDTVQAWKHGPAVPAVYQEFKKYKASPIPVKNGQYVGMSKEDAAFIRSIWESYKMFSAAALRKKTHNELPWLEARGGCAGDENSERTISQATMANFFQAEYQKTAPKGIGLEKAQRLLSEPLKRGKSAREIFRKAGLEEYAAIV